MALCEQPHSLLQNRKLLESSRSYARTRPRTQFKPAHWRQPSLYCIYTSNTYCTRIRVPPLTMVEVSPQGSFQTFPGLCAEYSPGCIYLFISFFEQKILTLKIFFLHIYIIYLFIYLFFRFSFSFVKSRKH